MSSIFCTDSLHSPSKNQTSSLFCAVLTLLNFRCFCIRLAHNLRHVTSISGTLLQPSVLHLVKPLPLTLLNPSSQLHFHYPVYPPYLAVSISHSLSRPWQVLSAQHVPRGYWGFKDSQWGSLLVQRVFAVTIPPMVGPTWSRVAYSLGSDYVLAVVPVCPSLLPLPVYHSIR